MGRVAVLVWLFVVSGWLLDWLSTVWPNPRLPEQNPFVRHYFGRYPDPLRFGLAKGASLAVFYVLTVTVRSLLQSSSSVPSVAFGVDLTLSLPAFVGVLGWVAFVHNVRLHVHARA